MKGLDNLVHHFVISRDVAMATNFLRKIETDCIVALLLILRRNLVRFGPVTPAFMLLK